VSSGRVTTPLSIAGKLKEKVRKVTQNLNGRGNLLQVSKLGITVKNGLDTLSSYLRWWFFLDKSV
jgi:hypothetical protein